MTQLTIRPAETDDLDAITAMLTASYGRLMQADYPPELLARLVPIIGKANPALIASGRYFVALRGPTLVGAGGVTPEMPGTGKVEPGLGHIRHFGTSPDHVRTGAASAIMRRCLDEAKLVGLSELECWSTRTAVPFYERFGFAGSEERDVMIAGIAMPSIIMRRAL